MVNRGNLEDFCENQSLVSKMSVPVRKIWFLMEFDMYLMAFSLWNIRLELLID